MKSALKATGTLVSFFLICYGAFLGINWMNKHLNVTQGTIVALTPFSIVAWYWLYKEFNGSGTSGDTKPGE